jgi:hypothetical protein
MLSSVGRGVGGVIMGTVVCVGGIVGRVIVGCSVGDIRVTFGLPGWIISTTGKGISVGVDVGPGVEVAAGEDVEHAENKIAKKSIGIIARFIVDTLLYSDLIEYILPRSILTSVVE